MRIKDVISIVIPTFNSSNTIEDCLASLINQEYEGELEITVVDDGSTDDTIEKIEKQASLIDTVEKISMNIIIESHKGPASARNTGIVASKGNIILFLDSDCIANPRWIKHIIAPLKERNVVGVGGTYKTLNHESFTARYVGYEIDFRHMNMGKYVDFIGSYSAAFKRDILDETGGFNEAFKDANAEDNDLSYRIINKGYKLVFQPKAWVWHEHPFKILKFIKQQFWRAVWRAYLYKIHPSRMKGDKYVDFKSTLQPIIWGIGILSTSIILAMYNSYVQGMLIFFLTILLILMINSKFIIFVYKKNSFIFTLYSSIILLLEGLSWMFGGILGTVKFIRQNSPNNTGLNQPV